ncbi:glucan synthase 1-related protein [Labilithrix luteola]|uniref:Glucan synthase 1-related protein n=1 Tax=Labilithrix luteola TaxID=1391654 RepID=A0A0K1QBF4_9BACT|nr:SMI1/KNR4 family protein [Labilithrix luteola]AKV02730.1 glucan synthase 1-related protein [Labilithrix luteola]
MGKTTLREPKPYVWIFRLGKSARVGKKRVPSAFADLCCYLYRDEHEEHKEELSSIEEPEVSERDTEVTFAAINEFADRCDLRRELYADAEIEEEGEHAQNFGFHAGASYEEAKAALEEGGFTVAEMFDALTVPPVKRSAAEALGDSLAALERHLDLTSLDLVLERIAASGVLTWHALSAHGVVSDALASKASSEFSAHVHDAVPGWHPELRDTLILIAGRLANNEGTVALRRFFEGLPAPKDGRVKEQLDAWSLEAPKGAKLAPKSKATPAKKATKASSSATSKKAPAGIDSKIAAIRAAAEKAGVTLPRGAPKSVIAEVEAVLGVALPDEVRAFYLAHDGGPPNEPACGGRELISLAGMVSQWKHWKRAFDDGAFEDDDVEADEGVQEAWWIPGWIPITYDFGGNHDMLDLAPAQGGRRGQIVSVWHDDPSRTVNHDDFLSWLADQEWTSG